MKIFWRMGCGYRNLKRNFTCGIGQFNELLVTEEVVGEFS